jgi:hypothetical protein
VQAVVGFLFAFAALGALLGLAVVTAHEVPPVLGTCALILTLAALGVALLH